jgi:alpha-tubulin suppressor-like RCC1 family protein
VTVYNPDGGYVSGNGAILSPPNACTWSGCVAAEGAARFGFSSRYHRGAAVPDGNTRFTFRDGNFTFSSTAYEWLVIAGARAQYKGVGTVNRGGNYGFMLTAIDSDRPGGGEEDRFRIKIWDRDNEDAVVYDNQAGEGDDADLIADGTRLTRGSITVRSTTRNEAPVVIITSPADGAAFLETDGILLSADAGDAEDGDLSASVVWSSDLAGELGVGGDLSDVSLAPGSHTITAYVVDSGGLEASASVAVEIIEDATPLILPQTIAGARSHTCGLTASGEAHCWGHNFYGQLGNGTTDNSLSPVPVTGSLTFTRITAGGDMTCALTPEGAAYCWGHGSLGNGERASMSLVPVEVSGGHIFRTISANTNVCGVTTSNEALCWGSNQQFQAGTGVEDGSGGSLAPRAVAGGHQFVEVWTRYLGACGVTTDGEPLCWGWNAHGQVGDGTFEDRSSPVRVLGGHVFKTIKGGGISTCGLTPTGSAFCWGSNHRGALGNESVEGYSTSPVEVSGGLTFATLASSLYVNCAVATDGTAYCWGWNQYGEVGDGTKTDRHTPTKVFGELVFASISGAYWHNCGVTPSGTAYCWGQNLYGQLGDGTTTQSSRPVEVVGISFNP